MTESTLRLWRAHASDGHADDVTDPSRRILVARRDDPQRTIVAGERSPITRVRQKDTPIGRRRVELGQSEQYGARELRRVFDQWIRQPLAQEILSRDEKLGTIRATLKENAVHFTN